MKRSGRLRGVRGGADAGSGGGADESARGGAGAEAGGLEGMAECGFGGRPLHFLVGDPDGLGGPGGWVDGRKSSMSRKLSSGS